ncbi:phage portal protein [Micromonospora ureilytica]|uniref:phage portal protein n=1 Tax=Micromonospora ureilytica TaxID=709868 RepID=UPI002E0F70DE|nr:phage portal protein [Micromonospora ureilytica]
MGILNRIVERRVAPAPTSGFAEAFAQQGPTWSGATVTQDSALTLSAVYTSVSLIADAVSSLPVDVVRTVGQTRKPATGPVWLNSPNPFDTPFDFWQKVMTSLLMDGNAFVRVIRSSQGKVVALMPLDPRTVRVELTEDQSGVLYKFGDTTLSARDVVHVKGFAQASSLRGLSPLESARQTIGAGLATQEFGARFFRQGTTMSGVIEHPGNPKPGEVAILARMLKKSHAGTKNSHAVGVLTGGASWKSISVTPEQAQFLETQRFNRLAIAGIFRVPAYMLDPTTASSWGSGVEEQHSWFVQQTLTPWLIRIEQAFSALLPNGQSLQFNVNARLRVKTSERYQAYRTAIEAGFMSVDEVRALEDREPLPGGRGRGHGSSGPGVSGTTDPATAG